ncbi:uncharacterized protein L199_002200 [Kwoniella botswanensis]|uniref:uncharacterized protein n=1 Tax=Kwoniella botswanensis TaxID=1268659 RepID=UPI00315DA52F
MPTFHPPLAHTSHVPIPQTASHAYVQLNFFATFTDGEDESGSWELWTDLPRLDDQGNPTSQPGEWRAAQFQPYIPPSPQDTKQKHKHQQTNGDATASPLYLKASAGYPSPTTPGQKTFYLSIVLPALPDQQYSYTYRHITSSGETQWLGGMGGNGSIKLNGDDVEPKIEGPKVGSWSENLDGVKESGWYGIAIELQKSNGKLKPIVHTIPSKAQVTAHLALLTAQQPLHSSTLSTLTTSPTATFPSATLRHLSILSPSSPLDISPSSIPSAPADSFYGLTTGSTAVEALRAAFKAAKAKENIFHLAEVSADHEDVSAIFISSGQQEPQQAYLIIHAPSRAYPVDIAVTLPQDILDPVPIALFTNSKGPVSYLSNLESKSGNRKIRLTLEKGAIAEVIQLAEFTELRGSGGDDPIWICAPDAINVEFGEEEISQPEFTAKSAPVSAYNEVTPVKIRDEEEEVMSKPSQTQTTDSQSATTSEEEENSVPVQPHPGPAEPTHGWWLLRFIGRFFVDIWELLLSPFRSSPAITDGTSQAEQREGEQEENDPDVPANERTPLLGSQSMSRETSSSSTAFDPLATPTSITTVKEELKPKYPTDGSITPVGHNSSPNVDNIIVADEFPMINSIRIRSYAQMTFNHLPPFKFLLPPNSIDITSKLKFTVREKAAQRWEEVEPSFEDPKNHTQCQEVIVEGKNGTGGTDWEVQVERI